MGVLRVEKGLIVCQEVRFVLDDFEVQNVVGANSIASELVELFAVEGQRQS